ncbi:MAG: ABC transporter ATP-binding protein [Kiloniellales bacterium]
MEPAPAVHLRAITKRFPGVVANDDISLTFHPGEIHVLLGENGAGKSTLMGILAGMLQPDAGEIEVRGRAVRIASPRESLDLGIGTVFQHVLLVPSLTVVENLMLGGAWWQRPDRDAVLARFRELSDVLAVEIDPDAVVGALSLGQQQQVEIMRALWRDEGVLILDEPTSMLTPQGVHELGEVMKRLRDSGVAIIFITHKLKEAYAFGDRISVLRLGRLVGQIPKERLREISEEEATAEVIRLMFGTEAGHDQEVETLVGDAPGRARAATLDRSGPPFLTVRDVSTEAEPGACPLAHVSFEVWPGEIFGIAGVDGNGQKHLAEVLAGQRKASSGSLTVGGSDVTHRGVAERRRLGVRYITDERLGEGTVPAQSVATNLVMKEIGTPPFWQHGVSHWDLIFGHARELIARHDIRTPSERTPLGRLSGGNIQKTLLARELSEDTRLVVFNKPTHGLDLHNTRLARERIRASSRSGLATVVISTELDELMDLCDRVGVMYQGALRGIVDNETGAEERVGLLMTGADGP